MTVKMNVEFMAGSSRRIKSIPWGPDWHEKKRNLIENYWLGHPISMKLTAHHHLSFVRWFMLKWQWVQQQSVPGEMLYPRWGTSKARGLKLAGWVGDSDLHAIHHQHLLRTHPQLGGGGVPVSTRGRVKKKKIAFTEGSPCTNNMETS